MIRSIALLLAVFLLSACQPGGQSALPAPALESFQAPPIQSQPAEPGYIAPLTEALNELPITVFASERLQWRLADKGITVSVDNLRPTGKADAAFDLILSRKDGYRLELPMAAQCGYRYWDGGRYVNLDLEWGGVSAVDADTIAVSTLDSIRFYDAATLTPKAVPLDPSFLNGKSYTLLGACRDGSGRLMMPVWADEAPSLAVFAADGSLQSLEPLANDLPFTSDGLRDIGGRFFVYQDCFEWLGLDTPMLLFQYDTFYDASGRVFGRSGITFSTENDDHRAELHNFGGWFSGNEDIAADRQKLALYYENGDFVSGFFFDGTEMPYSYGSPNREDYPGLSYFWQADRPVMGCSCSYTDLTITFDFEKKQATLEYDIQPEHMEADSNVISPNGRYSIHSASWDGGGDMGFATLVLKDRQTGLLRYLAQSGGMYGGNGSFGFLSNNDIYLLESARLRILEPVTLEPRPFLLPLGRLEGEERSRYLYTFRRDPTDGTFIVLFSESSSEDKWVEDPIAGYHAAFSYQIGLCDARGNLLERYDTMQPVLSSYFGLFSVRMQRSGDLLAFTWSGGKPSAQLSAVFDLKTKTYRETVPLHQIQ